MLNQPIRPVTLQVNHPLILKRSHTPGLDTQGGYPKVSV